MSVTTTITQTHPILVLKLSQTHENPTMTLLKKMASSGLFSEDLKAKIEECLKLYSEKCSNPTTNDEKKEAATLLSILLITVIEKAQQTNYISADLKSFSKEVQSSIGLLLKDVTKPAGFVCLIRLNLKKKAEYEQTKSILARFEQEYKTLLQSMAAAKSLNNQQLFESCKQKLLDLNSKRKEMLQKTDRKITESSSNIIQMSQTLTHQLEQIGAIGEDMKNIDIATQNSLNHLKSVLESV
ncbi:MAG: hypothetical protein JHC93_05830 [Parachlamydiales bacterium]|nr:hypothetical protein [Parachlamydiales bacterium]